MLQLLEFGARKTREMLSNEPNQNEDLTDSNDDSIISVEEKRDLESQPEDACLDENKNDISLIETKSCEPGVKKLCETINKLLIKYSDKTDQLDEAEMQIQSLSEEKDALDDELLDAHLEVASKNEQIVSFKSWKNQNVVEIDDLQKNVLKLQNECRVIKQQLAIALSRVHLLSADNYALKYLVEALTTSNAGLINEKFKLNQQLKIAQAEISSKDVQLTHASSRASDDQRRIKEISDEKGALDNQLKDARLEIDSKNDEIVTFKSTKNDDDVKISGLKKDMETLQMESREKNQQLDEAQIKIQTLSKEKAALETQRQNAVHEIDTLKNENSTLKIKDAEFQSEAKKLNQQLKAARDEISVKDRELCNAESRASEDQHRIETISKEKDALGNRLKDARSEIDSKNDEIKNVKILQMESCEKSHQLDEAQIKIQTLSKEKVALETQRQNAVDEIDTLKNENSTLKRKDAEFQSEVKNLNKELETLQMEICDKDRHLNQASKDFSDNQHCIQTLSEERDAIQNQLEKAVREIDTAKKNAEKLETLMTQQEHKISNEQTPQEVAVKGKSKRSSSMRPVADFIFHGFLFNFFLVLIFFFCMWMNNGVLFPRTMFAEVSYDHMPPS